MHPFKSLIIIMDTDTLNSMNSLASSIGNFSMAIANDKNGKTNVGKSKDLYNYQTQKQYEYLKKQLEEITKPYFEWQKKNSPSLDIAGLKSAGVNPLMAYGQNSLGATPSDSLEPQAPSADLGSILGSFSGQQQADTAQFLAASQAGLNIAETAKTLGETKQIKTFNEFARELYDGQAKTAQNNALNLGADIKLKREQTKEVFSRMQNLDASTSQLNALTANARETLDLLRQQGKINDKQIDLMSKDIALREVQMLREKFGLENIDPATIQQIKAQVSYFMRSGDALLPSIYWAQFLQSHPLQANDYFSGMVNAQSGQGSVQITQGAQGQISLDIRQGNFGKLFQDTWNKATAGREGAEKVALGSVAVGQMIVQVLLYNIQEILGSVAGFIK